MFKAIRGAKDILPEDVSLWQKIENLSRSIFVNYGYQEIRTPIIEDIGLFNRSLGSSSEIVQKQMFEIQRDKEVFCLRPEATASVVRAYIENHLDKKGGFSKFYYIGPMFRAERPQKGRLRQFHHIGAEAIGSLDPYLDVEIISLVGNLLGILGVKGISVLVNSLGCKQDKETLAGVLKSKLKNNLSDLCEDCQNRFNRNIFRILDCKKEHCADIVKKLKIGTEYLCKDCREHFLKLTAGLDSLGVKYELAPHLVRGLDYYTRTVFEIRHSGLGSQDAIAGGGRYDNLVKELGGPDVGAIGFSCGMERIILSRQEADKPQDRMFVYVIGLGEEAADLKIRLLDRLRKNGIQADTDYSGKSLKAGLRTANDLGAKFVILVGSQELKKNVITLKDMAGGVQKEVGIEVLLEELKCSERIPAQN